MASGHPDAGALNDNWGLLGHVIIALFAASWLGSFAIYRLKGYDEIEVRGSS